VETLRGRGGGICLARAPGEIRVGSLLRETEAERPLVECFAAPGACRIEPACALRGVLQEALEAFFGTLDRTTLADLVARRRRPLARLLAVG
jgi:Rrf2 family nitric oxide-sensitive transcriptional repressor